MKNYKEFLAKHKTAQPLNKRLNIFLDLYRNYHNERKKKLTILDIGCGENAVLYRHKVPGDTYIGCDYYKKIDVRIDKYIQVDLMTEDLSKKLKGKKFDVVFCGEVIEHLFSPDHMLEEVRKLMHNKSIFILSTPNLGYYMNRIMLLLGISPFYLENSSKYKLGRRFKFLGQGNSTEGHIRLFTYEALVDLIRIEKFKIERVVSCPGPWNFFLDYVVALFSRGLSGTNVFVLKKKS